MGRFLSKNMHTKAESKMNEFVPSWMSLGYHFTEHLTLTDFDASPRRLYEPGLLFVPSAGLPAI